MTLLHLNVKIASSVMTFGKTPKVFLAKISLLCYNRGSLENFGGMENFE